MTESYPIRCGKNPRAFLYSVQNILDHDGFVKVFPDNDMELLVDFDSDRMKAAIAKVTGHSSLTGECTQEDIFQVIEFIGDIVYQLFGRYNIEYLRVGENFSKDTDSAIVSRAR